MTVSVVAATPYPSRLFAKLEEKHPKAAVVRPILLGCILLLSVAYMVSGTFSPFLYYIF